MSPLDSIKYHRKHLQTDLQLEPRTGHIKAWGAGINLKRFQQDHIHTNCQVRIYLQALRIFNRDCISGIFLALKFTIQYTDQ